MAHSECEVTFLDISNNPIPDENLKMLMGVIYENENLTEVKYKPRKLENEKLLLEFQEKVQKFEQTPDHER